ncbi:uncharacterized protein LOC111643136 [Copidosoma floridanum]|uniref:uncharacterized protein LOC111643136 n=1 Tax=Copidosoma floridanum TaxID=29053 RepID=UPI000C6F6059|nr:uncharacterized protein LOC111643136 [Copidosoma floridanum]
MFNSGLIEVEDKIISLSEKNLTSFGLNSPVRDELCTKDSFEHSIRNGYDYNYLFNYVEQNLPKLVPDQRQAFNRIIDSVLNSCGKVFFLDALGGPGKTFLINLMLTQARSAEKLSLAVASSGVAATLVSGGRTAHSTFKLPLYVFSGEDYTCPIRKNGPLAKILQDTKFIVWDECIMSHRAHIEAINRT